MTPVNPTMSAERRWRVLTTAADRRWVAGEIGVELPNDFAEKYAYKLDLGTVKTHYTLLGQPITQYRRVFYFHANEVEPA